MLHGKRTCFLPHRLEEKGHGLDVGDPVTDHERQSWLSRSLLMHSQMRTAPGDLRSRFAFWDKVINIK
jgi:hypothetical protein